MYITIDDRVGHPDRESVTGQSVKVKYVTERKRNVYTSGNGSSPDKESSRQLERSPTKIVLVHHEAPSKV